MNPPNAASPVRVPEPADLPAGLTVDDAIRIAEAITASHAESTRAIYTHAWNQ